ncbi:hypothetical protein L1987_28713 [Smallanthus sonchifolius]|uniref:Uncharacterized protein n=1 Tax=Smallanthus sonchifolius TaxID=185202 RepID=A0ACB9HZE2_9ASTR|nr:hypothetical protein L1987_28713 [Smallanthus sonchifolius]
MAKALEDPGKRQGEGNGKTDEGSNTGRQDLGDTRFSGVKDKTDLELQLRAVNLNHARLAVNLAKFNKGGKPIREEEARNKHQVHHHHHEGLSNGGGGFGSEGYTGRNTYKNALLRNQSMFTTGDVIELPEEAGGSLSQWFGKPEKKHTPGQYPSTLGNLSNSGEAEEVESSMHGEGNCMAMGSPNNDIAGPHSDNSHRFHFLSKKGSNSLGQKETLSPTFDDIAKKLRASTEPISRKRPRLGDVADDPFSLERINGEINPIPIKERRWGKQVEESSNSMNLEDIAPTGGTNNPGHIDQEVKDTIRMGKELVLDLENEEDMVRATIIGELEEAVAQ